MEKTHVEMQRYHYQAVREHPEYRIIGLLDCEAELRALDTPAQPDHLTFDTPNATVVSQC